MVSSSEDSEEDTSENVDYEVVIEGGPMEQNWFIALYSVHCGNDLRNMNEESIRSYVADTIPYTVTEKEEEEEAASSRSCSDGGGSKFASRGVQFRGGRVFSFGDVIDHYLSDAGANSGELFRDRPQLGGIDV